MKLMIIILHQNHSALLANISKGRHSQCAAVTPWAAASDLSSSDTQAGMGNVRKITEAERLICDSGSPGGKFSFPLYQSFSPFHSSH